MVYFIFLNYILLELFDRLPFYNLNNAGCTVFVDLHGWMFVINQRWWMFLLMNAFICTSIKCNERSFLINFFNPIGSSARKKLPTRCKFIFFNCKSPRDSDFSFFEYSIKFKSRRRFYLFNSSSLSFYWVRIELNTRCPVSVSYESSSFVWNESFETTQFTRECESINKLKIWFLSRHFFLSV